MFRKFRFRSVKYKMLFGFSLIIFFILIIGGYMLFAAKKVNDETIYIVDEQVPVLISNQQIAYTLANRIGLARAYVTTGDPYYREMFDEYSEMAKQYATQMEEALVSTKFDPSAVNATYEWEESMVNDVFNEYDQGNHATVNKNMNKLIPLAEEMMKDFESWALSGEGSIKSSGDEVIVSGYTTVVVVSVITILVVVLGTFIALTTSRSITNSLVSVMEQMKRIAKGDLSNEPLVINSKDEIGQLMQATNEMNHHSRELIQQIHFVSEKMNRESEELANAANEVKASSEQVAHTMIDIASGSESQANHIGNVSHMMGMFANKVADTTKNGEQIQQASNQVLDLTTEGSSLMKTSFVQMEMIDNIVHEAVEKVEGLDAHSKEISSLVLVIQDVAEQTNLLALNAAIEAARAGEHGKGFAVVADEVRKLAEQVSFSVTDITKIVDDIQRESSSVSTSLKNGYIDVAKGTNQIRTTRETFDQISSAVKEMVRHISGASSNLAEILTNTEEMNSSIQEVAAISEEAAAGVEQTSAQSQQSSSAMEEVAKSSTDLAKLAEQLDGFVRRFTI